MILVRRPVATQPAELLFVRRHPSLAFMGGAHVFPGGKIDPEDREAALALPAAARAPKVEAAQPAGGTAPNEGVAACVAACRELFEEAGVLLCEPTAGPQERARVADAVVGGASFGTALARLGREPALGALTYVARWITPSAEPRRFDARFFFAWLPEGQQERCDGRESSEAVWLAPAEALARHRRRELVLPPPTLRTVERLAEQLPTLAPGQAPPVTVAPVLPKLRAGEGGAKEALMPWDPEYPDTAGDGIALAAAPELAAGPSRIVMRDDVWTSLALPP